MERKKSKDIKYIKKILKQKQERIKSLIHDLKRYKKFVLKLEKLKNIRLRDLEHIPDYSLKLYRIRKDAITSLWGLIRKEIDNLNLGLINRNQEINNINRIIKLDEERCKKICKDSEKELKRLLGR